MEIWLKYEHSNVSLPYTFNTKELVFISFPGMLGSYSQDKRSASLFTRSNTDQ